MTMRVMFGTVAASALMIAAGPAAAQDKTVEFSIDGDSFSIAIPDGFCEPEGEYAEIATKYASGDTRNVTPVDLQRCGTFEHDYVLVKSPKRLEPIAMSKAVFIPALAKELEEKNPREKGEKRGYRDMRKETERDRDVAVIEFGFGGSDDQCAYLSGELVVTFSDDRTERVYVGSCGTLVGNRHVFVHSYGRVESGATIESMKARSRAVSEMITPQ